MTRRGGRDRMRRLTAEERAERARQRMINTARQHTLGTYLSRFVAPEFQRMIRAEAAALPAGLTHAIVGGRLTQIFRRVGECVCVTCGKVSPWSSGIGGMHTGHFLASRRASIVLEEDNVAPQCSRCNRYESGAPLRFRQWMLYVRSKYTIERLLQLRYTPRHFSHEELVDLRIGFQARLKTAETLLNGGAE